jgi:hypothetical protein
MNFWSWADKHWIEFGVLIGLAFLLLDSIVAHAFNAHLNSIVERLSRRKNEL